MRLVEARVEPFGVVGPEWLRAAVALR